LIRTLAHGRRIVGMDLVEYSYTEGHNASAFLCAKLIYKSLSYIFEQQTEGVRGE
jgi:arginase family enzyme